MIAITQEDEVANGELSSWDCHKRSWLAYLKWTYI